jgi:hypothetical protein
MQVKCCHLLYDRLFASVRRWLRLLQRTGAVEAEVEGGAGCAHPTRRLDALVGCDIGQLGSYKFIDWQAVVGQITPQCSEQHQ